MNILAFDIGGTKCAVITARWDDESITLLKKEKCLPEAQNCSKRRSDKKYQKPNVEMCK